MRRVYADHAGTAPPAREVIEAMLPFLGERFGNPSSVHARGEAAREAVDEGRARVAELLGALPEEVVFTATGSEANNLALEGALAAAPAGRDRLVISAFEHPSIAATARHLASRGTPVTIVPVGRDGVVEVERVREALGPDVALVSVMWVNNEVGTIQPVTQIAELAHAAGALFHTDAVQAVGKLPVAVGRVGADLLSLAGHKFGGPVGAAALYARRRTPLVPLVHGGHQERGRRAGTEAVAPIVGLGVAAARAARRLAAGEGPPGAALGVRLLEGLETAFPEARLNGDRLRRLPSLINLRFPGVDGEALLHELDRDGVTVSTGSACSAGEEGPSPVLLAMGLSPEEAHASVRFSLGEGNDLEDVEHVLEVTPGAIGRLRELAHPGGGRSA